MVQTTCKKALTHRFVPYYTTQEKTLIFSNKFDNWCKTEGCRHAFWVKKKTDVSGSTTTEGAMEYNANNFIKTVCWKCYYFCQFGVIVTESNKKRQKTSRKVGCSAVMDVYYTVDSSIKALFKCVYEDHDPFGIKDLASSKLPVNVKDQPLIIQLELKNSNLAKRILAYYAQDVWCCLSTADQYVNTAAVTIQDFSDYNVLVTLSRLRGQLPRMVPINMKEGTAARYFEVMFPRNKEDIINLSNQAVQGRMRQALRFVDIRTAYVLAMRNLLDKSDHGYQHVVTFYNIFLNEFMRSCHCMPYIRTDGILQSWGRPSSLCFV